MISIIKPKFLSDMVYLLALTSISVDTVAAAIVWNTEIITIWKNNSSIEWKLNRKKFRQTAKTPKVCVDYGRSKRKRRTQLFSLFFVRRLTQFFFAIAKSQNRKVLQMVQVKSKRPAASRASKHTKKYWRKGTDISAIEDSIREFIVLFSQPPHEFLFISILNIFRRTCRRRTYWRCHFRPCWRWFIRCGQNSNCREASKEVHQETTSCFR